MYCFHVLTEFCMCYIKHVPASGSGYLSTCCPMHVCACMYIDSLYSILYSRINLMHYIMNPGYNELPDITNIDLRMYTYTQCK